MTKNISYRKAESRDLSTLLKWTWSLHEYEKLDNALEIILKPDAKARIKDWLSGLIDHENALIIIAEDISGKPLGGIVGLIQSAMNDFSELDYSNYY